MTVTQATEGMHLKRDHVYIIPPNCEMTLDHGGFHLHARQVRRAANATVDTFFRSLASSYGSDSIGVILSGTAS